MWNIDYDLALLFNPQSPSPLDGLMLLLTNGITWIPLYILLIWMFWRISINRRQFLLLLLFGVACVAAVASVNNLVIKPLVARPRPFDDPSVSYLVRIVGDLRASNYSFFSSHAANTAAIATYCSMAIRRRAVTVGLVLWCAANCYTRLYLAQHFASDVMTGILAGVSFGLVFYMVYEFIMQEYGY